MSLTGDLGNPSRASLGHANVRIFTRVCDHASRVQSRTVHVTDKLAGSLHFHRSLHSTREDDGAGPRDDRCMMTIDEGGPVRGVTFHLHTQDTGPDPVVLHGVRVRLVYGIERLRVRTTP